MGWAFRVDLEAKRLSEFARFVMVFEHLPVELVSGCAVCAVESAPFDKFA